MAEWLWLGVTRDRTAVVTETQLVLAREHPERPEAVYVLATYKLSDVRRLTSKKTHRNIITVVVRTEDGDVAAPPTVRLSSHTLLFEDAADFVDILKGRLRPAAPATAVAADVGPVAAPTPPDAAHGEVLAPADAAATAVVVADASGPGGLAEPSAGAGEPGAAN